MGLFFEEIVVHSAFSPKVLGPILRLPEILLTFSTSAGQAYKMAYLHQKRLNFIQKGQNESRYS